MTLDSTATAAVDHTYHWLPITTNTPMGVKLQLINRQDGTATYGPLSPGDDRWTHWAPMPTFKDE